MGILFWNDELKVQNVLEILFPIWRQECSQSVPLGGGQIRILEGQFIFKPFIYHFFSKYMRGRGCSLGGKFCRSGEREFNGRLSPPGPSLATPQYEGILKETEINYNRCFVCQHLSIFWNVFGLLIIHWYLLETLKCFGTPTETWTLLMNYLIHTGLANSTLKVPHGKL